MLNNPLVISALTFVMSRSIFTTFSMLAPVPSRNGRPSELLLEGKQNTGALFWLLENPAELHSPISHIVGGLKWFEATLVAQCSTAREILGSEGHAPFTEGIYSYCMQLFAKQFNPSPLRKKPHEMFILLITNAQGSQFTFHSCLLVSFLEHGFRNQPTEWGKRWQHWHSVIPTPKWVLRILKIFNS